MDESQWDEFAETYAAIQRESTLPIEQDVINALAKRYSLANLTVADVAAGSGRYALPLSQHGAQVTLYDWSAAMLIQAQQWLLEHHQQAHYQQANWKTLQGPLADVVFVSQLPTLKPTQLLQLEGLARKAVVINTQSQQSDSVQQQLAEQLDWPIPPVYQADPRHAKSYFTQLAQLHRKVYHQSFTYQRQVTTTINDELQSFERPFSLKLATQMATQFHVAHPQAPLTTTITYQFELIDWRKP
ncbi:class I SAM-dependent methyltransferase [Lacticaseibacillus porcinae]|uniref:class I SAM-dependent methyltransferase n=1 Tax=Lacticaseibacillus porcinae TaxID=1123687 RepID=UPI000F7B7864|nr:class I SAM-dependent methyltransferase [Lacticaseibacillus porcinae]